MRRTHAPLSAEGKRPRAPLRVPLVPLAQERHHRRAGAEANVRTPAPPPSMAHARLPLSGPRALEGRVRAIKLGLAKLTPLARRGHGKDNKPALKAYERVYI